VAIKSGDVAHRAGVRVLKGIQAGVGAFTCETPVTREEDMTTRRDLILGLSLTPFALTARNIHAAGQAEAKPQFLFVQSAEGMQYADGVLTLKGVSPITILFSDRPERLAGHMATEDFVPFWSEGAEGGDSFESQPPNADIAVLEASDTDNVVVTLHDPKLEGDDLSYRVDVLEGQLPANGGAVSLFIDVIGMPLTPVSFAGRRRRMWRRRAL